MTLLAAQGDTWGISGPAFIRGYVIGAVAALILTLILRQWARRGRQAARPLHPYELAYLAGGGPRAMAAAVAALRTASQAVRPAPDPRRDRRSGIRKADPAHPKWHYGLDQSRH